MTVQRVDTTHFRSAASPMTHAQTSATQAIETLLGALSGCGSMAGSTDDCIAFGHKYDEMARSLASAMGELPEVAGWYSAALVQSAVNHEVAESMSAGKAHPGEAVSPPVAGVCYAAPPSAVGADGGPPANFDILQRVKNLTWPDADAGKLRAAGAAWNAAATSIDGVKTSTSTALRQLDSVQSVEMGAVEGKFDNLTTHLGGVADNCRALGNACTEFADGVERVHNEVIHMLEELAVSVGVTLIVGVVFGVVGEIAAGCVAAAEATGPDIEDIINGRRYTIALNKGHISQLYPVYFSTLSGVLMAISIATYLGRENDLRELTSTLEYSGDDRYIEGSVDMLVDGVQYLSRTDWDLVDQLWCYIANCIEALSKTGFAESHYPDSPVYFSMTELPGRRVLLKSSTGVGDHSIATDLDHFLREIGRAGQTALQDLTAVLRVDEHEYAQCIDVFRALIR